MGLGGARGEYVDAGQTRPARGAGLVEPFASAGEGVFGRGLTVSDKNTGQ